MDRIIKRHVWNKLVAELDKKPITILLGPRRTGKTTLVKLLISHLTKKGIPQRNIFYYNFDDVAVRTEIKRDFRFIKKDIELKIGSLLEETKQKIYLFIDEGQKAPQIFDLVKILYDENILVKTFISGSSSIDIREKSAETLGGRTDYFYLYPLTFQETVDCNLPFYQDIEKNWQEKSLKELAAFGFRNKERYQQTLARMLFSGGLPETIPATEDESINYLNNFINTYLDKDVKDVGGKVNLENFHLSFKYLAEYSADLFNFSKIEQTLGIKRDSLYRYFEFLEKTLVVQTVSPFIFPKSKHIFKSRKLFFFDCGVVNRLRGFVSFAEIERARFLGKVFENFIFQNLFAKMLNDPKRPSLYYFRNYQDKEIDLIYQRADIVIPIEITYSNLTEGKFKNFSTFFTLYPKAKYGIIFYLGEVKRFHVKNKIIFALPYFLA